MLPKIQLLAVLAFGVAMLLIENQIQKLDESRAKLGKTTTKVGSPRNPADRGLKTEATQHRIVIYKK